MQQQQPTPEIVEPQAQDAEPFSPAIMKLAETYQLGQPRHEYLASFPLDPYGGAIGTTIAVWLFALLFVFLNVQYPWIIVTIIVALLLTLLIWAIAFFLQRRRKETHFQRVYVCDSGLLCQKFNAIEPVHWHHIETVNYDTIGNCQVYRNDGAIFFFSPPLQQIGELSSFIEQAVIPHHLPPLLTSYRDGLPIVFGPLRINLQGIGLTQKNVTLFAWDKIQGIERRFDGLILKLYNDRTLNLPLTAHEIPSVNLAQALIHTILEQAEQATQELSDAGQGKPRAQKGQRGQRTQKSQEQDSGTPTDGALTNIMGDPIGTATSDRLSIVVYERGFLYLNKIDKKLDITRWDQVAQVIRHTHNSDGLVEYSIEVTCNDGARFIFPRTQPRIAGIGLYVEQKAAEWALPALFKQYDAGETTAFGKLNINQTGITYNKHSLLWSEVYQVRILQANSAYIGIKQRGYSQEWQLIAIDKIPDVYLLKLLIDHILSTHPAVHR
jgi:hypothetical protein